MNIRLEFRVYPRFLDGLDEEVEAIFENAPYVPNDWRGLWVRWEDFYDKETADIIYKSIRQGLLTPNKTLEQFEKDRILVQYEFVPHFGDNELYEMGLLGDDDEDFEFDFEDENDEDENED